MADSPKENNFGQDVAFLKKHLETVVLRNDEGGAIAVVPAYQGRTMTSTAGSDSGKSYGYINYDAIASEFVDPQINVYGGEDRVWISPDAGQHSIFFEPGVDRSLANWRTPAELDSQPFAVQVRKRDSVSLTKNAVFTNWIGTRFDVQIDRSVKLLNRSRAASNLGVNLNTLQVSAYESHNTLINRGATAWQADTGLIGIRLICMSKPAPAATLIVPSQATDTPTNDATFSPQSSWDPDRKVLSVISCNLSAYSANEYKNLRSRQNLACDGDVVNGYGANMNDGNFFQMETHSPALALAPGEGYTHIQRTVRVEGSREKLSAVTTHLFGVDLDQIESQVDRL